MSNEIAGDQLAAFDPTATYVELRPDGRAVTVAAGPGFWEALASGARRVEGRLVTGSRMTADWPHWEIHPAGEELLFLASGSVTLVCDNGDGVEWRVALAAGRAFLVPAGVWHRAIVHAPGLMIGVTQGDGTRHRPV